MHAEPSFRVAIDDLLPSLVARLEIDDEWLLWADRRVTWWAGDLAQHFWIEPMALPDGRPAIRLHAETDYLRVTPLLELHYPALSLALGLATTSSLYLNSSARVLRFHCALNSVEEGNEAELDLLAATAALQVAEAHKRNTARQLADRQPWLEPAVTSHPQTGRREQIDLVAGHFDLTNDQPLMTSWLDGDELGAAEQQLSQLGWHLLDRQARRCYLAYAAPAQQGSWWQSAALVIDASVRHPELGAGVRLQLTKRPFAVPLASVAHLPFLLNSDEHDTFRMTASFGAWGLQIDPASGMPLLQLTCFFPTMLGRPTLLAQLAVMMHRRHLHAEQRLRQMQQFC